MVLITRNDLPLKSGVFQQYELTVAVYFFVLWVAHLPYNDRSLQESFIENKATAAEMRLEWATMALMLMR